MNRTQDNVPFFLREWIERMSYHQIIELTLWMDSQSDVRLSIEKVIGESLEDNED